MHIEAKCEGGRGGREASKSQVFETWCSTKTKGREDAELDAFLAENQLNDGWHLSGVFSDTASMFYS